MPDVSNIFSDSWLHFVVCLLPQPSLVGVYSKAQKHQASVDYQEWADASNIHWPLWSLPEGESQNVWQASSALVEIFA